MSISVEGQKCPVCGGYLFDDDDLVFCPVCGAPHHRDCYNTVGHCGLEDKHGTNEQYNAEDYCKSDEEQKNESGREKTAHADTTSGFKCRACGADMKPTDRFCPNCHTPVNPFERAYVFNENENIGGVKAGQIVRFAIANPARYLEVFRRIALGEGSWNWAAFLFPAPWQFFRKNYKSGAVFATLTVISQLLRVPFYSVISGLAIEGGTYMEAAQELSANMDKIGVLPMLLALIGLAIGLGSRIFAGLKSDKIYFKRAVSTIKEAGLDAANEIYHKKGGVSFFAFILSYGVIVYLPEILLGIAGMF